MKECRQFRVSGRVQGVGFRFSACAEARRVGVTGWVRNLPNGDVEVFACGESDRLKVFAEWLWQGPRAARVTNVATTDAAIEEFDDFDVR